MGDRYLISGAQIGMLLVMCEEDPKKVKELLETMLAEQRVFTSTHALTLDCDVVIDLAAGIHDWMDGMSNGRK